MQDKLSTKKGFTLIEIVIALAIAALIIVIVLLAVQGAQRSQRNDGRRAAVNKTRAAITDARGNNGGADPTAAQVVAAVPTAEINVQGVGQMSVDATAGAWDAKGCAGTTATTNLNIKVKIGAGSSSADQATGCLEGGAVYLAK